MSGNIRNIPGGTRDIMFGEAELFRHLDTSLTELYRKNGFSEISTPAIEYYDVFETGGTMGQEKMYKLTAPDGRLLVLRADNTTPIARVAATRLGDMLPVKLFYHQKVYRLSSGHTGRKSEIAQSGIEILGSKGIQSDLLCMVTAIETLSKFGRKCKLELGHVGFYNALISECGLDASESGKVRRLVEAKDVNKISGLDKIAKIPFLFGGEEVFDEATELAGENEEALKSLSYLKKLYSALCEAGYKDSIMIDLGIVHSLDYYTGAVFRGYMDGAGEPVLVGGRYDSLISRFERDIPATGFGVNVSEVVDTLMRSGEGKYQRMTSELVCFDTHSLGQAVRYVSENPKAELSPINGKAENLEYAKAEGYKTLTVFEDGTQTSVEL